MAGQDWSRILNGVFYFIVVLAGVITTGGVPKTWESWILAIATAVIGGYGKYSTETRLIGPNRQPWPEQLREEFRELKK